MVRIIHGITIVFDWITAPFSHMHPMVGLCVFSCIAGYLLMKLFYASMNKVASEKAKNRIKAHLLEMVLYRHNMRISLQSLGKIVWANCVYVCTTLVPLAVVLVPCVLIMGQLSLRFGVRPLNQGEETVLKVRTEDTVPLHGVTLELSDGLQCVTPLLRIADNNEINVRIRADKQGRQSAIVKNGDGTNCQIDIYVETAELKISPCRYKNHINAIISPGYEPIKKSVPLQSITVSYPEQKYGLFGFQANWLGVFCCVSILAGISLKMIGL
ncbi:MAG: hypothetical protein H7A34_02475 [bacterium]|nr:hypothetical protein [bacterium]